MPKKKKKSKFPQVQSPESKMEKITNQPPPSHSLFSEN